MVLLPARLLRGGQDHGDEHSTSSWTSTSSCSPRLTTSSTRPGEFPLERLRQARSLEVVVARVAALFHVQPLAMPALSSGRPGRRLGRRATPSPARLRRWLLGDRLPRPLKRRELLVLGVDLENDPFLGPIRRAIDAATPRSGQSDRLLLDELSNLDFGWPLVGRFDGWELGRTAVRIVGGFPMLRGFAADGVVICSDDNFVRLCERPSTEEVQFGFLKLRDETTRSTRPCRDLRAILPPDVVPYSRAEILRRGVGPLGRPDGDRQAVRVRRAGRDDRGLGGDLPGPLQRRARPPRRIRDAQGDGPFERATCPASSSGRR